jgi:integrase
VLRYREDVLNPDGSPGRLHRSVVLGSFRTRREAQRAADVELRTVNDGAHRPQMTITLADFWTTYFEPEILPTLKYSTRTLYRLLAKKHLLPALGHHPLRDLARLHVQQFIGQKQRQGYAPQTLAHFRNLLSKTLGTAVGWGWMESNPAENIDLPPMERRRSRKLLTPAELQKLTQALGEPVHTIVLMGALTGLRIGELLGLYVEDVDLTRAVISVRRDVYRGHVGTPKTPGSERQVPLASSLIPVLTHWLGIRPAGSEWLFPSAARTPLRDRNLMRRHLWPACESLGITRFGWHSLRHTFSTYNGNAGVAMPVLQALLGHASPETTMIYTHPLEDVKRQAVENLARLLFPNVPSEEKLIVKGSTLIQ